MDERHPVQILWDELDSLPASAFAGRGVEALRRTDRVDGIAFFPVGSGLWGCVVAGRPPAPSTRKVMVLGNNFSNRANCDLVVRNCGEALSMDGSRIGWISPTWRQLLPLLSKAGIDRVDCFFTNCYMALVAGGSNVGEIDVGPSEPLEATSRAFLRRQVELLRPSVIACLGSHACAFLARTYDVTGWPTSSRSGYFAAVDQADAGVCYPVQAGDRVLAAVALVHPSYRHVNALTRSWRGQTGDIEAEMLKEARRLSGGA